MKLTINLATRGRPDRLIETVQRTLTNMVRDETTFLISVDRDDKATIDALASSDFGDRRVIVNVDDREDSLGGKYNRALRLAPADLYLPMVDYAPHITPGFDQKILDAAAVFPDNICVIYNHLICASLPAINAISHGLAMKMGYLYPTHFPFSIVDLWMDDIGRAIDRIGFADVIIDRSARKETIGRRDVKFWMVLFDLLLPERMELARSIILSSEYRDAPWRKAVALQKFPAVAARSNLVSAASRQNSEWNDRHSYAYTNEAEDARYQRIMAKAKVLMRDLLAQYDAADAQKAG